MNRRLASLLLTSIALCNSDVGLSTLGRRTEGSSSAAAASGVTSEITDGDCCDTLDVINVSGIAESSMRLTAESVFVTVTRC
jgi:hypothetical protein